MNSKQDIEYNKFIAKYRLKFKKREETDLFFCLEQWPRHLVRILFKLGLSGSSGDSETGHTARFKIASFLFCNGLSDPISYIKMFHPTLPQHITLEIVNSVQYIKDIFGNRSLCYCSLFSY